MIMKIGKIVKYAHSITMSCLKIRKCTVCHREGHNRRTCVEKGKMNSLPNELLIKIGTYVDIESLTQYFSTSKRFWSISQYILKDRVKTEPICAQIITNIETFKKLKDHIDVREVLYQATYSLNFDLARYIYKKYNTIFADDLDEYNAVALSINNGAFLKHIDFQNTWSNWPY